MVDKITTPGEMMGILNWALVGYDRLMKQNKFTYNTSTEDVRTQMKRKSNSFHAFLQDEIVQVFDDDSFILLSDIDKYYNEYCRKHKITKKETKAGKKTEQIIDYGGYKTNNVKNDDGKQQCAYAPEISEWIGGRGL